MRVTPILAFMLLGLIFSSHQLPVAPYLFPKSGLETCEKYWWTQIIHFQNYVNFERPVSFQYRIWLFVLICFKFDRE